MVLFGLWQIETTKILHLCTWDIKACFEQGLLALLTSWKSSWECPLSFSTSHYRLGGSQCGSRSKTYFKQASNDLSHVPLFPNAFSNNSENPGVIWVSVCMYMGVFKDTAEWDNPKEGKSPPNLIVSSPAPAVGTGRLWEVFSRWWNKPRGAGSALSTDEHCCGFACCALSHSVFTWCHTSMGLNELPGPLTQTLRGDADQSRWMDNRIHKNNGKEFTWMMHCKHNTSTARNTGKSWTQKVLLWKMKNFVPQWVYAITAWLEFHFWHFL